MTEFPLSVPFTGTATAPARTRSRRAKVRSGASLLGPAFVAAIAYVDPGNFATNLQGGAQFGYRLLWVVLLANLVAMPIQYLSAKLGIATGKSLPAVCREQYGRSVNLMLWAQAEVVAMSTDLAEFVGAAIGLNLLFHVPMFAAGCITGVVAFGILALQSRGFRQYELAVGALLTIICAGFLYETLKIGPSATGALQGLSPSFAGSDSVLLAVAIVGATVMPHAIYMHSDLTAQRAKGADAEQKRRLMKFEKADVGVALGLAGLVNISMLAIAAKLFHGRLDSGLVSIVSVHKDLAVMVGGGAALMFAVALLASGLSSSSVGTYAGQVVMDGFLGHRLPMVLRRLLTMVPALVVLGLGVNPTHALVMSQVVLSLGIPFALIPLVLLTSKRSVMGEHRNGRLTVAAVVPVTTVVVGLNVFLLAQAFTG